MVDEIFLCCIPVNDNTYCASLNNPAVLPAVSLVPCHVAYMVKCPIIGPLLKEDA